MQFSGLRHDHDQAVIGHPAHGIRTWLVMPADRELS